MRSFHQKFYIILTKTELKGDAAPYLKHFNSHINMSHNAVNILQEDFIPGYQSINTGSS